MKAASRTSGESSKPSRSSIAIASSASVARAAAARTSGSGSPAASATTAPARVARAEANAAIARTRSAGLAGARGGLERRLELGVEQPGRGRRERDGAHRGTLVAHALDQRRAPLGWRCRAAGAHDRGGGLDRGDGGTEIGVAARGAQRVEVLGAADLAEPARGERAHAAIGVGEQASERRSLRRPRLGQEREQGALSQPRIGGGRAFERDRLEHAAARAGREEMKIGKEPRLPGFARQRPELRDHPLERHAGARETVAGPGRDLVVGVEQEAIEQRQGFLDRRATQRERRAAPDHRIGIERQLFEQRTARAGRARAPRSPPAAGAARVADRRGRVPG